MAAHNINNYQRQLNAHLGGPYPGAGLAHTLGAAGVGAFTAFQAYRETRRDYKRATMETPKRLRAGGLAAYVPATPSRSARLQPRGKSQHFRYPNKKFEPILAPMKRKYSRRIGRRTRLRRPYRRRVYRVTRYRRKSYRSRRYTRRRIMPDFFRGSQNVIMVPSSLSTTTASQVAALQNHSCYTSFMFNPAYFCEALGSHGFYDRQLIGTGATLSAAQTALVSDAVRNNNGYRFGVRNMKIHFRITPDWQEQGKPDDNSSAPKFSDISGMVVEAFVLRARERIKTDQVMTASGSGLLIQQTLDPLNSTAFADTSQGWISLWANGIQGRVGAATPWTSATTLVGFQAQTTPNLSVVAATAQFLSSDGVSMYHSGELTKKYKIRRAARKFIPAGTNSTLNVNLGSCFFDTDKLDLKLPLSNPGNNISQYQNSGAYLPRGWPIVVVRQQVFSNAQNKTCYPPITYLSNVVSSCKYYVPGSKHGGNLYYQLEPQGAIGSVVGANIVTPGFPQPSNPSRAGGQQP